MSNHRYGNNFGAELPVLTCDFSRYGNEADVARPDCTINVEASVPYMDATKNHNIFISPVNELWIEINTGQLKIQDK